MKPCLSILNSVLKEVEQRVDLRVGLHVLGLHFAHSK